MSRNKTRTEKISSEAGKHAPRCNCGDSEEDLQADVQSRTNYPLVVKQHRGFVGECREGCEAARDANENKKANLRVEKTPPLGQTGNQSDQETVG
jgi:hypothetical protein